MFYFYFFQFFGGASPSVSPVITTYQLQVYTTKYRDVDVRTEPHWDVDIRNLS